MRKPFYLISLSALLLASCGEETSSSKKCGDGTQLPIIIDSIFAGKTDDNMTHEAGECLSSEKCVYLYDKQGGRSSGYACSSTGQGSLLCDGKEVDALTDDENCGICGNKCQNGASCTSGVCLGENEPVSECVKNDLMCDEDGKTLKVCGDMGWQVQQFCQLGCANDACVIEEDPTKCDKDGALQCDDAQTSVLICANGHWQTQNTCVVGCKDGQCLLDSDGDGVVDEEDPCPNNGAVTKEGATSCLPYDAETGTFTIYTMANMTEFEQIMKGTLTEDSSGHALPDDVWNIVKGIKTVVLAKDINMADGPGTPESDDCILGTDGWSGSISLQNITLDGQGHALTAVRVSDGARCTLQHSLFSSLMSSSIKNIKIDLDVKSSDACGIIAASAKVVEKSKSVMDSVTLSGSLVTNVEDADGVGGMFGVVKGYLVNGFQYDPAVVFNNCIADGISVTAPHSDNVGGLFGALDGARIKYSESAQYIKYVEGRNHVGGVIGYTSTNNNSVIEEGKYARFVIDTVKGNDLVGGYSGTGIPQSLILVINSVTGNDIVGGVSGTINNISNMVGEKYTNSYINDIAFHVNKVVGRSVVGGLMGRDSARVSNVNNIYAESSYIGGKSFVAGLIGNSGTYDCDIKAVVSKVSEIADLLTAEDNYEDIKASGERYFSGLLNKSNSYGFRIQNVSSCATIESGMSSPSAGLHWSEGNSYAQAFLNKVIVTSSRIFNNSTAYDYAITNAPISGGTASVTDVYYMSFVRNENAVTNSDRLASQYYSDNFSEKDGDLMVEKLGEGWDIGSCSLTDASGMTSVHKIPVYRQKVIEDMLSDLKQTVAERQYFTVED